MLNLAVATAAETLDRMREPLADRGIRARHIQTRERAFNLSNVTFGPFDVGFVYPPRLMEGSVVDTALAVPWVNDRHAVLLSRNKAGVITRLGDAGLPVPKTVFVSNPVGRPELRHVFQQFEPPVVVKPNSATRGLGVTRAIDLDSFFGITDYLSAIHAFEPVGDRTFLVQEFLEDARDYRAMVIGGEYVGAVERVIPEPADPANHWKYNVHQAAHAERIELPASHRALAEETARVLGIDFLGVDMLETEGRVIVTETNARPTIDTADKYNPIFYDRLADIIKAQLE